MTKEKMEHAGEALKGWPVATVKAGQIVARDGKIVGNPTGRYLPRAASNVAADVEWVRSAL
jgi:N-acyl-D-aspartate/D-glutamate deacylase